MNDHTYEELLALAKTAVDLGRRDGIRTHEPDMFYEQGAAYQLQHAYKHVYSEYNGDNSEDHISHAICRLLFYLAIRKVELAGQHARRTVHTDG